MMATSSNSRGGYDFQFVKTPADWLICNICQHPSREPHLSGCCGHTFCKYCLEAAKGAATITDACPICRCEEFATTPHKQADRTIRSLYVFCTNRGKGCEWQGEVNDIINHLGNSNGCQFEEVICSNYCGQRLQRQYLTSHVKDECVRRKVDCQYCQITGEHQFIEGEHKEQCSEFLIACPKVGRVPRDDVEEHMKKMEECLSSTTHQLTNTHQHNSASSQTAVVNNKEELSTKILATTKQHLTSAVNTIDQLLQKLQQTENGFATKQNFKEGLVEQIKQDDLTLRLQQTENHLTVTKQELAATKDDISIAIQNLTAIQEEERKTKEAQATLETKFQTKITDIEAASQKRIAELETKLEQKTQQIEQFISDPRIFWYNTINYSMLKVSSGDQVVPVIVKMSEYTKKKRNFVNWYSESFYTHPKGYKMCLYVYAPGDNGTHLLAYLFLVKGPYDNQLRWPLKGRCEVKLLNQISNSRHHVGIGTYQDGGRNRVTKRERSYHALWYTHQFISYEDLHKITTTRQYLKDDSIFLQVDYELI